VFSLPFSADRPGLLVPPQRKAGLGGAALRWTFYVLLGLIACLCVLALITDRVSPDNGHAPREVTVSTSTKLVDQDTLQRRLQKLRLQNENVDIWVIAQEGEKLKDVHAAVVRQAKQEHPGWLDGQKMAPHKLVVFLNITDKSGHADSGLYVGMDLDSDHLDANRRQGNEAFAKARWQDGITTIVKAQAGRHPLGPVMWGVLSAGGVIAVVALLWIVVTARRQRRHSEEQLTLARTASDELTTLIPHVEAAAKEAAQQPDPNDAEVPISLVTQRVLEALGDLEPARRFWLGQLDGYGPARLRSATATRELRNTAAQLSGLVTRARGLLDVASMAGGLHGWEEAALRQSSLLRLDADAAQRMLTAPSVQATERTKAVEAAVDSARSVADETTDSVSAGGISGIDVLEDLEEASTTLGAAAAHAGIAAAATMRKADLVVQRFNASVCTCAGRAVGPTVGRFTTVDVAAVTAHGTTTDHAYPTPVAFTDASLTSTPPTQGHRLPIGGNGESTASLAAERLGELVNPYVVVPGAAAVQLAIQEAGGLPLGQPSEGTDSGAGDNPMPDGAAAQSA
jgi:hypothetical protein